MKASKVQQVTKVQPAHRERQGFKDPQVNKAQLVCRVPRGIKALKGSRDFKVQLENRAQRGSKGLPENKVPPVCKE